MFKLAALNLKKLKNKADWKLLIFLILFLNVKLVIKIPAIVLIYLLQPDFRFGFSLKNTRLPLFYPAIIVIALVNWVVNPNYHHINYALILFTGIGFWLMCLLASHQIKYAVDHQSTAVIHHTLLIFLVINALLSLCNIGAIMLETHAFNPYLYQGQFQKYFISTGDFIKGISFDTSTTNALFNAFGVVYFLNRKNVLMLCVCMSVLLLTGSNAVNLSIALVLVVLLFFGTDKDQKSLIFICAAFMAIFLAKVSPQNNSYSLNTFKSLFLKENVATPKDNLSTKMATTLLDSDLLADAHKKRIARLFLDSISLAATKTPKAILVKNQLPISTSVLTMPKPDLNAKVYQAPTDTDAEQKRLLSFIAAHSASLPLAGNKAYTGPLPGKVLSFMQTFSFFRHHPSKIFMGNGTGNFSSKLAFRATNLGFAGGYPHKYVYIDPDFLTNHLDVYLNFFSKGWEYRSITNSPYATYDQLLAEYGLAGLLVFGIGYLWFFAKNYKYLTYGLPVLALTCAAFFMDYWFEQLSVVTLFELLMFLDMKEHRALSPIPVNGYGN